MNEQNKPLTYNDLAEWISKLTPEQRAMNAMWVGENEGGRIDALDVLTDDQVNPSGDGWESLTAYRKAVVEGGMMSEQEAAEDDGGGIVARKGQPLMLSGARE